MGRAFLNTIRTASGQTHERSCTRADRGALPEAPWKAASADPAALAQFRRTVAAWADWARQNARFSAAFFAEDRKQWPKDAPARVPAAAATATGPASRPGT